MAEEHFAALRPRRSNIITPENSPSPSLSNFRQYNQRDLHTAVVAVKPRGPRKERTRDWLWSKQSHHTPYLLALLFSWAFRKILCITIWD